MLAGQGITAAGLLMALAVVLLAVWSNGDGQFARAGASMGSATGLGRIGQVAVFEQPHTGGNYLLREMIYVVGRKHAAKLRMIAVICAAVIPAGLLLLPSGLAVTVPAVAVHLIGAFAARWLFFAEAEHVVGLYYGARG
jgi:hypothetical protein